MTPDGSIRMAWLKENGLALYGAIVGTIALGFTVWRARYDKRKDSTQLRVTCHAHAELSRSRELIARYDPNESENPISNMQPAYVVTVYNDGAIPAHIADVGVTDRDGNDASASIRQKGSTSLIYGSVKELGVDPLSPKSSKSFTVYLITHRPLSEGKACYVIDGTGKRWTGPIEKA
jgi:hypothetical protein